MEVMEEGNLMDRVPILLERDMQYYQKHQSVLQEPICAGVVGGHLDFPRYASFASIKIVIWWEEEFFAAYRKHSGLLHSVAETEGSDAEDTSTIVVKDSDPDKFVGLVTKSAELLMAHLHVLSQESLDHADLSVLTATIGAAALIKNCLKIYLSAATTKHYPPRGDEKGGSLKISYKEFSQMAEALAERLLDLHCRILLLYTIQDADCVYWEDDQPFFESERGSYTIQMWWHYLRGTKDDLWNSVPPKMAQRIFAGMLNETLSILTIRYSHIVTGTARAQLHLVDICNMLFCVAELLPHISESGEAYLGLKIKFQSIIIRDVHAKCRELFYCLLLRGAPLGVLSKVFRKGLENMEMFSAREGTPSRWIVFVLPRLFPKDHSNQWVTEFSDLNVDTATALELKVLLGFPEADWAYIVRVLLMRDAKLSSIILPHLMKHLPSPENFKNVAKWSFTESQSKEKCAGFMCRRECFNASDLIIDEPDPVGQTNCQLVLALTYVLVALGKSTDIKTCLINALEKSPPSWCECLNKHQVWNQKRPPWLEAIIHLVYPVLDCIVQTLINEVEAGANMHEAMELALEGMSHMWECIPEGVYKTSLLLQETISVSTKPLGDSVLFQVLFSALYTELIKNAERFEKNQSDDKAAICYSLSEAICSIDEDDEHRELIKTFLDGSKDAIFFDGSLLADFGLGLDGATTAFDRTNEGCAFGPPESYPLEADVGAARCIAEVQASDILIEDIGKQSLKVLYNYMKINKDWLFEQLNVKDPEPGETQAIRGQEITETKPSTLRSMFYIGHTPFDQLLTGALKIDYSMWLQSPISLNPQRAWLQIARRTEFQPEEELTPTEAAMVGAVTNHLKDYYRDCPIENWNYWMTQYPTQNKEDPPEEEVELN